MTELYMTDNWKRRGSALWIVANMLRHYHQVEVKTYNKEKKGSLLSYNEFPSTLKKGMRSTVLVGGFKLNDNGVARNISWNRVSNIVFNSDFYSRICLSAFNIKNHQVIHILGGAPSDPNMFDPCTVPDRDTDELHFVVCAKWWKRKFKRLRQSVKLFNEFILPKYPNSVLHILGTKIKGEDRRKGRIIYHAKSFHKQIVPDVYRRSHIQLILTPFDTGPLTLTESLHYRIPFVCSTNCCGPEVIEAVCGLPGEAVAIDKTLKSVKDLRKCKPITRKGHYNREIDYELVLQSICKIVDNYNEYVSWSWTPDFNYKKQADKWMDVLFG